MKWVYLLAALLYLISPYDLLPDFLGLPGRLDDIAVLLFVYIKYFRPLEREQQRNQRQRENESRAKTKPLSKPSEQFDPFKVLEISPESSHREIDAQYRLLMSKYHPDKVNHLGDELKKLAHDKSLEIQRAYEMISKK